MRHRPHSNQNNRLHKIVRLIEDLKLTVNMDGNKKEYMREIVSRSEGAVVNALHGIKFEITNIGERYHGLNLTILFFVEAQNEPWIRTTIHQKIIEKLVEEKVPFHRDSPK